MPASRTPQPGSINAVLNDWHADEVDGPEDNATWDRTNRLHAELANAGYSIVPNKLVHAAYVITTELAHRTQRLARLDPEVHGIYAFDEARTACDDDLVSLVLDNVDALQWNDVVIDSSDQCEHQPSPWNRDGRQQCDVCLADLGPFPGGERAGASPSSASSQHFIDTGRYLTNAEDDEWKDVNDLPTDN